MFRGEDVDWLLCDFEQIPEAWIFLAEQDFNRPVFAVECGGCGADPQLVEDFLSFLRGGDSASATPLDARMAVAAGYLGTESLRNGGTPLIVSPIPNH